MSSRMTQKNIMQLMRFLICIPSVPFMTFLFNGLITIRIPQVRAM